MFILAGNSLVPWTLAKHKDCEQALHEAYIFQLSIDNAFILAN